VLKIVENLWAVIAPPQTPLGSSQHSPDPLACCPSPRTPPPLSAFQGHPTEGRGDIFSHLPPLYLPAKCWGPFTSSRLATALGLKCLEQVNYLRRKATTG